MIYSLIRGGMLLLLMVMSTAVHAQSWQRSGGVELGYVETAGNTDTRSIKVEAHVEYEKEKWKHRGEYSSLKQKERDTTTADRYEVSGKSNYKRSDRDYYFGLIKYEDDEFSGYDYRITEVIGYGRKIIDRATLKANAEIGPGARQSKLNNGSSDTEAIVRLAGDLAWTISDSAKFTQTASAEVGEDAVLSKGVSALESKINSSLAMNASFTIRHTSNAAAGKTKTDRETALTLVYSF